MALWFSAACGILVLTLVFPMNAAARTPLRGVVLLYGIAVVVALLVMRHRTPMWFLHVQTLVSVAASLWLVHISLLPVGAVTAGVSLIVVAAYLGFWMRRATAMAYMTASVVAYFVLLASDGLMPLLVVPWALISAICLGLLASFGALVSHMNEQLVTDPLTGLLNRSGMAALVDRRGDDTRTPSPRSLMVIDLDQFKEINDRHGHLAGDRTLMGFGEALRDVIRPDDIAFRSGGDEFVLILPRTEAEGAEALAQRLRETIDLEWSYGITDWAASESFDSALARADRLMYQQKATRAEGRESAS